PPCISTLSLHDALPIYLYFFVGAGSTWPAAGLWSVSAGDWSDRADRPAYAHTTNPASSATASASATATHTSNPVATYAAAAASEDRKSTRLNSCHLGIS